VTDSERPAIAGEQLSLFEGLGIDVSALRRERAAIAELRRAPNTIRAYASDWRDFETWCAAAGRCALPVIGDTLALYCVHLARIGRAMATIVRRASSVAARHLAAGQASPVDADVSEVLAALRRKLGTAQLCKAAVSLEDLARMLAATARDPRGVRDRAILLVGFASALRRSELAALNVDDVEIERRGLVISLKRSKTDQQGAGREVGVHRGQHRVTCPVRALEAWLQVRPAGPGALFVAADLNTGVLRMERRLSGQGIAAVVKAAAKRAGLDAAHYAGHSLRAGCATVAAEGGANELAIMARTGHKSVAMVARYVRHGSLFAIDPLDGAL
jgi:site-specific recombinase XerD